MVQTRVYYQRAQHKLCDNDAVSPGDLAYKLVDHSEALCVEGLRLFRLVIFSIKNRILLSIKLSSFFIPQLEYTMRQITEFRFRVSSVCDEILEKARQVYVYFSVREVSVTDILVERVQEAGGK